MSIALTAGIEVAIGSSSRSTVGAASQVVMSSMRRVHPAISFRGGGYITSIEGTPREDSFSMIGLLVPETERARSRYVSNLCTFSGIRRPHWWISGRDRGCSYVRHIYELGFGMKHAATTVGTVPEGEKVCSTTHTMFSDVFGLSDMTDCRSHIGGTSPDRMFPRRGIDRQWRGSLTGLLTISNRLFFGALTKSRVLEEVL